MDDLAKLMLELRRDFSYLVPVPIIDAYLTRYKIFYNQQVKPKPLKFIGACHWSFKRKQEFLIAFDQAGLVGQGWLRTDAADARY